MRSALLVLAVVALAAAVYDPSRISGGFWRLNCHARPVYTGRVDSIVNPGAVASHVHRVLGGSGFSPATKTATPMEVFQETFTGGCSSCALQKIDNSNYWHPELYWMNQTTGEMQVVSSTGAIIYYFSAAGAVPFPAGIRYLAGSTTRRSYNGSLTADQAISYTCLQNYGAKPWTDDGPGFPTKDNFCGNLMRAQIWFPQCWDGVNLDSADHKSHMSYPTGGPQQGDCPASHPVRIPGMFWELTYNTGYYPHGDGFQNFVWSNGDTTGFGLHGDFINGWNSTALDHALHDSTCAGGEINDCETFSGYVVDGTVCPLDKPVYTTEDVGLSTPITSLPGCNSLSYYGADVSPSCSTKPSQTKNSNYERVYIQSTTIGAYMTVPFAWSFGPIHVNQSIPLLDSTWVILPYSDGTVGILNSANGNFLYNWNFGSVYVMSGQGSSTTQGNTWATFTLVNVTGGYAIKSVKDGTYLKVQDNGFVMWNGYDSPTASSTFKLVPADGGYVTLDSLTVGDSAALITGDASVILYSIWIIVVLATLF